MISVHQRGIKTRKRQFKDLGSNEVSVLHVHTCNNNFSPVPYVNKIKTLNMKGPQFKYRTASSKNIHSPRPERQSKMGEASSFLSHELYKKYFKSVQLSCRSQHVVLQSCSNSNNFAHQTAYSHLIKAGFEYSRIVSLPIMLG